MADPEGDVRAHLLSLSRGFRSSYLRYDELTAQLRAWSEAFPEVVRLQSLARTPEGRDLWLLTIGRDPDRIRPAAWVDANMHACELAGSSAALSIAEDALSIALGAPPSHDLPAHLCDLLREDILFYILPRMCPDGAEHMLTVSSYVRSNPRDDRHGKSAPYFRGGDIDGDGRSRTMRIQDPAGQFATLPGAPDILVPREIDDPGPFYSIYPEGLIENWDGHTIPAFDMLGDNAVDLNRNFPFHWSPEPRQAGAGAFATSEPESRAVVDFASRHPNIFAWLNLHTYGGCYIRPSGDKKDSKMHPADLWIFQQIERFATPFTGYPVVSGFEEFTYEPDTPLCGDLVTFAHEQRGCVAMVCELWDFWKQAGTETFRPFVRNYVKRTREDIQKIVDWDRAHNRSRLTGTWRPFTHPQLGPVEIGGFDPLIGVWNPPEDRLAEICENQSRTFLRWAALTPRLRVSNVVVEPMGEGIHKVTATVENIGFLATNVLEIAKSLPWNDPVQATLALGEGVSLVGGAPVVSIGHLTGWSPDIMFSSPSFARTTSGKPRATVHWIVRGAGEVVVSASCARTGTQSARIALNVPS